MNLKPLTSQAETRESLQRILRLPAVLQVTGLARSTVYRMMVEHTFPAPVKLAKRAVGCDSQSHIGGSLRCLERRCRAPVSKSRVDARRCHPIRAGIGPWLLLVGRPQGGRRPQPVRPAECLPAGCWCERAE